LRPCLEVCVDSIAGLDAAAAAGADRIELCCALNLGGLTPSQGLLEEAAARGMPCFVLIRSRAGDFCYAQRDIDVMARDIDSVRSLGLAGVVIGANRANGALDEVTLTQLLERACGMPAVLHRAFDLVPDQGAALETAIRLGFKRVLSSGGAPTAVGGHERIRSLVQQAGARIEVMAGAGLSPENVTDFVRSTGVTAVHSSCSSPVPRSRELDGRDVALGFTPEHHKVTDPRVVTAMLRALQAFS